MKWLTQEQVKKAADKSEKAALACSIKHWEQLATATAQEIQGYHELTGLAGLTQDYCSICERAECYCVSCVLGRTGNHCNRTGSTWDRANFAYWDYIEIGGIKRWYAWKRAAQNMLTVLRGLRA